MRARSLTRLPWFVGCTSPACAQIAGGGKLPVVHPGTPHFMVPRTSEPEPQRELHLPRGPCAEGLTERRVDVNAVRKVDRRSINRIELCVIKHIERFRSEREYALLAAQIEIPEKAHIEIASTGTPHHGFVCIPQGTARKLNTGGVEELIGSLIGVSQVGITSQINPLYIAAAGQVREHNRRNTKRRSAREGRNTGKLPASCNSRNQLSGRLYAGYVVLPIRSQNVRLVE